MRISLRGIGLFLISLITGTLYALVVGLFSRQLAGPLYSWPVWIALFLFVFWKYKVLRYVGFIWVLPISLLAFEMLSSTTHPGMVADKHKSADRSHYVAGRVKNPETEDPQPNMYGAGLKEILISPDGFRADPETGRGNPARCQYALIGDSMIYGSGLPYAHTFGPVLAEMGLPACVFGVTGNSTVDYLATLKFVAPRLDPGAHIAIYLYAYNDFVSLNKYFSRGFLSFSNWLRAPFEWASYFDQWRQSTFIFQRVRGKRTPPPQTLWEFDIGKGPPIQILYHRDPKNYPKPKKLNQRQRVALKFFFDRLTEISRGHGWRVSIVVHPDDAEIYANFAARASRFNDLDPRRADALEICKEYSFPCVDISRFIYERSLSEGKNPYFINNRHFSIAGTRIIAENFVTLTKQVAQPAGVSTSANVEKWFFRLLCKARLGDCPADPPEDGSATTFKAKALSARSKRLLMSDSRMVEIPRLEAKKGSVMPVKTGIQMTDGVRHTVGKRYPG